jgi:hypothetical protein
MYNPLPPLSINPPAFVCHYKTGQNEIIEQFEIADLSPMELVKDALIKGIAAMKEFNERLDKQYPNSQTHAK